MHGDRRAQSAATQPALLMGRFRPLRRLETAGAFEAFEALDADAGNRLVEVRKYALPQAWDDDLRGTAWRRDTRTLAALPDLSVESLAGADAAWLVLRPRDGPETPRKRTGLSRPCVPVAVLEMLVAALAAVLIHAFLIDPAAREASVAAQVQACAASRQSLSTALELYRNDHGGSSPPTVAALVPEWLSEMPRCPRGGVWRGSLEVSASWRCSRCTEEADVRSR